MFRGEIEIEVRNAETLEIEEHRKQSNIVLNTMFDVLSGSVHGKMPSQILVTTKRLSPSRISTRIPAADNTYTTSNGTVVPGRASPEWFAKDGNVPMFIQWNARIDVPSQNRQINTIMLTDLTDTTPIRNATTYGGTVSAKVCAQAKLAQPCSQSTTQILDVYYRIYFPDTAFVGLPHGNYSELARRLSGFYTGSYGIYSKFLSSPFRYPALKYADQQSIMFVAKPAYYNFGCYLADESVFTTAGWYKRKASLSLGLNSNAGALMGNFMIAPMDATGSFVPLSGIVAVPNNPGKIQNLFGRRANTTNPGHTGLDVDNLPTSSGIITPSGEWQNKDTPKSADLYYSGKWPTMFYLNITAGGPVGTSRYKLRKRPYLAQTNNFSGLALHGTHSVIIPALSSGRNSNNSLIGDLSKFTSKQLSATVKYDDVSVAIPSKNSVLLYNIANSDYWRYTGGFTDIHQLAVVGEKIYIACRNTGLWMLDPKNSNVATQITTPATGIDLSVCHGVAKGYNNSLWAVGNNGVVFFDGTEWKLYNETTTPAFNLTGISGGKWSNVEYIKANAATAAGELLLVRKYGADVDNGIFGCWWSLAGVASNANSTVGNGVSNVSGIPRLNRTHVGCSETTGQWVICHSGLFRTMTFGTTTISNSYGSIPAGAHSAFASIMFAKNAAGVEKQMSVQWATEAVNYNGFSAQANMGQVFLYNADGTVNTALNTAAKPSARYYHPSYDAVMITPESTAINGLTGVYDYVVAVDMGNGIVFTTGIYDRTTVGTYGEWVSAVTQYPLDRSMAGPLQHLSYTDYGWDGQKWVAGNANDKPTHAGAEPLVDGISLAFTNGQSGTSFVNGEAFNFAACEGLLKDNATSNTIEVPLYFKKAYASQTALSSNTIPITANTSQTGVVGPDYVKSSSLDFTMDANGNVVFTDEHGEQAWIGDKELVGDFKIKWDLVNSSTMRDVLFGIGFANYGYYAVWSIDNVGNVAINYFDNANNWQAVATRSNGSSFGVAGTTATSVGIQRVGNVVSYLVNDVVVTLGNIPAPMPAGRSRYDVYATPSNVWQQARMVANRTCPKPTIISNGADNAIKVGNAIESTGAFHPKYYAIDTTLKNGLIATIGGLSATVKTDYSAPLAGEMSVDPIKGTLIFNVADEGKAVTLNYTYQTHE